MGKFKMTLEVGGLNRSSVRNQLFRSKEKLEYAFNGSTVSIREEKSLLSSEFYIVGTDFPDTPEFESIIRGWETQIRRAIS